MLKQTMQKASGLGVVATAGSVEKLNKDSIIDKHDILKERKMPKYMPHPPLLKRGQNTHKC